MKTICNSMLKINLLPKRKEKFNYRNFYHNILTANSEQNRS